MTASEIIDSLRHRGVAVSVEAGKVNMTPASEVTDADLDAVRAVKGDIIRLLTAPGHGSAAWPIVVHGSRLAACPWDGCGGRITSHRDLHLCLKCRTWFKLIPMEGVYKYE